MKRSIATVAALVLLGATPAGAQRAGHDGHPPAADNAATAAYRAAAARMHRDMGTELTGDADVDFAQGMIPHHQGAIEMARIVLEHGSDPEIRRLAENIIAAQEAEIAILRDWLARHGQ